MRKKFFLVGAFVVIAMSAMFISCDKEEPSSEGGSSSGGASNGCTCTYQVPGFASSSTSTYSASDLNSAGVSNCSAWEEHLKKVTDYESVYCY